MPALLSLPADILVRVVHFSGHSLPSLLATCKQLSAILISEGELIWRRCCEAELQPHVFAAAQHGAAAQLCLSWQSRYHLLTHRPARGACDEALLAALSTPLEFDVEDCQAGVCDVDTCPCFITDVRFYIDVCCAAPGDPLQFMFTTEAKWDGLYAASGQGGDTLFAKDLDVHLPVGPRLTRTERHTGWDCQHGELLFTVFAQRLDNDIYNGGTNPYEGFRVHMLDFKVNACEAFTHGGATVDENAGTVLDEGETLYGSGHTFCDAIAKSVHIPVLGSEATLACSLRVRAKECEQALTWLAFDLTLYCQSDTSVEDEEPAPFRNLPALLRAFDGNDWI